MTRKSEAPGDPDLLSIGELAARTGIAADTLRVWEKRYGQPVAVRLPSGHRRYREEQVRRLRRVAEAIARGHRPSRVVALEEEALDALLAIAAARGEGCEIERLLGLIRGYKRKPLRDELNRLRAQRAPEAFLVDVIAPLLERIGRAWADGELSVRHEHFASELIEDLLRSMRLALEREAPGGRGSVLLATLGDEQHDLGLQMVALVCTARGAQVRMLGTRTPLADIAAAARELGARVVGISVSLATGGPGTDRELRDLRAQLPATTVLVVGGAGARGPRRGPAGIHYPESLAAFGAWLDDRL